MYYHVPFNRYNILKPHHEFWDTLYMRLFKGNYICLQLRFQMQTHWEYLSFSILIVLGVASVWGIFGWHDVSGVASSDWLS
jgi:hypothetical protein